MRKLHFAFVTLVILALAACGGIGGGYSPLPSPKASTSAGTATVSFLVVVPPPSAMRNRPKVILPSNATSVTFTIDSVNGTAYSGTPTTETLSSSNAACSSVDGQLSCLFNLSAPVGALVYTVTVYNGTTVIAEGNVAVTTTSGTTVTAPLTLTGTVAKIAITGPSSAVAGIAATYALTVQAEDSNGNTILGTYTSPITLTDSDTSGSTSITTSGSDSPPAGELISSSDTATLNYNGGTLSSAATIGASASGVSASNVTTATFAPATNYLAQSGSVSFGVTSYELDGYNATPTPTASPAWSTSTSAPVPIATGQSFDGVTNAIGVTGLSATDSLTENDTVCCSTYLSPTSTTYYVWSGGSGSATLGLLGFSDSQNTYYPDYFVSDGIESLQQTCAAPYAQLLVLPMPTSWNVFSGSGACTTTYTDTDDNTDVYQYASNGSYTDSSNLENFSGGPPFNGTANTTVSSTGAVSYAINSEIGVGSMVVPAPSPGASTIPVTFTAPGSYPFVPTPVPSSAPNPWAAIGLPNGVPPSPLLSDTFTNKGAITTLPAMCAVPAGLVPASAPPLSEADESIVAADPMDNWLPLYMTETIKHYYLNGVGEICNENQATQYYFDFESIGYIDLWSYNGGIGGAIAWYDGIDDNYDTTFSDTYTYITNTSLQAVALRVRDFTKVAPTAAMELSETTYALAHGGLAHRFAMARHHAQSPFMVRWKR